MPELPEVEFARRCLVRWMRGRQIVRTETAPNDRSFRHGNIKAFLALRGRLTATDRHGKFLIAQFSNEHALVLHLGMTGKLLLRPDNAPVSHSRARFILDSGQLIHFVDQRRFGRIECVGQAELAAHPSLTVLGVDPLRDGLTVAQLKFALAHSRQDIKVALMDQSRIAGLGNIHAAEALFWAGVHPTTPVSKLADTQWKALQRGIHTTIKAALSSQGDSDDIEYVEEKGAPNPFWIYARNGEPCRRCGAIVQTIRQAGRSTFFCPKCQNERSP